MTTLRERVAGERRRLRSVRETLTAAVGRTAGGDPAFIPFYLAVAEYIGTAMDRLHAQDVKMGDMIRAKLGPPDPESARGLAELDERLAGNQRLLHEFLAARDALAAQGAAALARFEAAGRAYTGYIVANMGHHGATTDLAARLFSTADWDYMAGITPAETRREEDLYARVFAALPAPLADLRPVGT
jgi:hypothetical protein